MIVIWTCLLGWIWYCGSLVIVQWVFFAAHFWGSRLFSMELGQERFGSWSKMAGRGRRSVSWNLCQTVHQVWTSTRSWIWSRRHLPWRQCSEWVYFSCWFIESWIRPMRVWMQQPIRWRIFRGYHLNGERRRHDLIFNFNCFFMCYAVKIKLKIGIFLVINCFLLCVVCTVVL